MIVLDTDYMSLLQRPEGRAAQIIHSRLRDFSANEIATAIVSFEEQIRGWFDGIRAAKTLALEVEKYRYTKQALLQYCGINILDFDEVSAAEFQRLRKRYRRLGTMDLKIASIVLAHRARLWTRNMRDFGQIVGLGAVDITRE